MDEPRSPASHAAAIAQHTLFRRVFGGVGVAMFLAAADQTILASALPAIANALGGVTDLSWVVVSYLLAATVAAPLYGYIGDRFGRRRALLLALGVFTLASAACAAAPGFLALVLFRALQGLGGGGLMTLSQALIGEHIEPRERGRYAGYFAIVFGLASTLGPVLGALLTEHLTWRAVFLINLPLGFVAAVLALRVPHAAPARRAGAFQPDVVGALLFCAATASFLFLLSSGGHRFAWVSWPALLLLAGAAAGFAALLLWERRHPDPLLPLHLFKVPAIARADLVALAFGAALFATIVYLPLYLQLGRGLGIGASGLLLLPITIAQAAAAAITGRLITRTGEAALFPVIGLALAALAFAGLAFAVYAAPTQIVLALTVMVGVGLGMVMPSTQIIVQAAAGRRSLGVATATISLSRAVGGALGVALVGAVLFGVVDRSDAAGSLLHQALEGGATFVAGLTAEERGTMAGGVGDAYRSAFLMLAAVSALGALVARTVPAPDWSAPERQ
jgi:EmrB/QacA subfamily drug resistance transporter